MRTKGPRKKQKHINSNKKNEERRVQERRKRVLFPTFFSSWTFFFKKHEKVHKIERLFLHLNSGIKSYNK